MTLYNFLSKIVIVILNLLKFIGLHIRINELETRAIGHFSVSIELYLLSKNKNKNKKYFDIWFRNKFRTWLSCIGVVTFFGLDNI